MDIRLLDSAYHRCKQSEFSPYPDRLISRLQVEFPGVDRSAAEEARARAVALISAACEWAEQLRGPNNDGGGTPSTKLAEHCPGFSDGVYADAEAWGLYWTK
jgi:hypothetical protein